MKANVLNKNFRRILILLFMVTSSIIANAQNEDDYVVIDNSEKPSEISTIFGNVDDIGFYGAINTSFGVYENIDMYELGFKLACIIDHSFAIGFAASAFANNLDMDYVVNNSTITTDLVGGYGGLLLEPIILPKLPVHISVPILIGVGGVSYTDNIYYDNVTDEFVYTSEDADAYFMLNPGLEVELNVFKFMRLGIGAYYRYAIGMDLDQVSKDALNGLSAGVSLKFGNF